MNIVESASWLNLKPENGFNGGFAPGLWTGRTRTITDRNNKSKALKNYIRTDEHRANISNALRGKPSGRTPNKNKITITDGINMRFLHIEDEMPIGWYKGKPVHISRKNANRIWINDGISSKMMSIGEIIPIGWNPGRTKFTKRKLKPT